MSKKYDFNKHLIKLIKRKEEKDSNSVLISKEEAPL